MFGKVYFIDGNIESITSYNYNPAHTELYFTTASGVYGYKLSSPRVEEEAINLYSPFHYFYKYCNHWFLTNAIERIEIFTEVLGNGALDN